MTPRRLQDHLLLGVEPSPARAPDRRCLHPAGPVVLAPRPLQGSAGAPGRGRHRPAGAGADRRLVDGQFGSGRAAPKSRRNGSRCTCSSPPPTFGALIYAAVGIAKRARESRRRGFRRAGGRARRADLLPARPRRAGRRPARRPCLQHLAADGRPADPRRPLRPRRRGRARSSTTRRPRSSITASSLTPSCCWRWESRSPRGGARTAPSLARRAGALAALAFLQAAIGIVTLILVAPIEFALAHQAVALLLFGMAVAHWRATAMESETEAAR